MLKILCNTKHFLCKVLTVWQLRVVVASGFHSTLGIGHKVPGNRWMIFGIYIYDTTHTVSKMYKCEFMIQHLLSVKCIKSNSHSRGRPTYHKSTVPGEAERVLAITHDWWVTISILMGWAVRVGGPGNLTCGIYSAGARHALGQPRESVWREPTVPRGRRIVFSRERPCTVISLLKKLVRSNPIRKQNKNFTFRIEFFWAETTEKVSISPILGVNRQYYS